MTPGGRSRPLPRVVAMTITKEATKAVASNKLMRLRGSILEASFRVEEEVGKIAVSLAAIGVAGVSVGLFIYLQQPAVNDDLLAFQLHLPYAPGGLSNILSSDFGAPLDRAESRDDDHPNSDPCGEGRRNVFGLVWRSLPARCSLKPS